MIKKFKKIVLVVAIAIASFLSFGFVDNFFEISKNLDIFSTLYKELNILYVDETRILKKSLIVQMYSKSSF